jgi:plasmid stabilization system protein ParE
MKVRYTATARDEIADIISYIGRDNPRAAARVASAIEIAITLLSRHPRIRRVMHESGLRGKLVGRFPYRIFYMVTDEELIIRNVRSTLRLPPWERQITEIDP